MFDILENYKTQGHFFLQSEQDLQKVCNAPVTSGVYVIYALKKGRVELVYIGHAATALQNEIINGQHFGKTPAYVAWPKQMTRENIEALNIYWYVTNEDSPEVLKRTLLKQHQDIFGAAPKWNKAV
jgi:hypothetical protein